MSFPSREETAEGHTAEPSDQGTVRGGFPVAPGLIRNGYGTASSATRGPRRPRRNLAGGRWVRRRLRGGVRLDSRSSASAAAAAALVSSELASSSRSASARAAAAAVAASWSAFAFAFTPAAFAAAAAAASALTRAASSSAA